MHNLYVNDHYIKITTITIASMILLIGSISFPVCAQKFVTLWGSEGTGNGQFNTPAGIAIDSSGNLYVVDEGNNRIQVFAPNTPS